MADLAKASINEVAKKVAALRHLSLTQLWDIVHKNGQRLLYDID